MNLARAIGHALGYELIKEAKSPSLRSHLARVFDRYRIDTVLDVGANHGQFGAAIRSNGYRGAIYSFEPVTASFERLAQVAAKDDRWHVFKLGLGDRPGRQIINIARSSDLCSLLAPNDFGRLEFPKIEADEQESIEIDTLDHFLAEQELPTDAGIFLKMDTQGYDLKVFEGAAHSLGRIAGMLSELSLSPIYENAPHYLESLAAYEARGFRVSGLYPVSRNSDLAVIEVDCVLIK